MFVATGYAGVTVPDDSSYSRTRPVAFAVSRSILFAALIVVGSPVCAALVAPYLGSLPRVVCSWKGFSMVRGGF